MGLLGFFFSKWFLKFILIIVSIFVSLELLRAFISFAGDLDLLHQVALITIILLVLTGLSFRFERLKFLSGILEFLCLTTIPLILVFSFVLSASIPFPIGAPVKLGALVLPFLLYVFLRRRRWIWGQSSSLCSQCRNYGKLSKNALLPKAIEDGHIVYNAGVKGLKVLRFIQLEGQQLDSAHENTESENHFRPLTSPGELLTMIRKRKVEVSYELYFRNETLEQLVCVMCEGRDYRESRSSVDDLSRKLIYDSESRRTVVGATASLVEDSIRAKRILAMPLFAGFESLRRIENDDYDAKTFSNNSSERPTKLRSIYLRAHSPLSQSQDINIVNEVVQAALAQRTQKDFACLLHIKPLSDRAADQELKKADKSYQEAMTHFVEVMRNGFFNEKASNKTAFFNRGKVDLDPRRIMEESKIRIQRLREAEEVGYFEVSMAMIGEPTVAESIARLLKNRLAQRDPDTALSLVHVPPTVIQGVVRRDLAIPLGRVNGNEVQLMLAPTSRSGETVTSDIENNTTESFASQFAEGKARSSHQLATAKCLPLKKHRMQLAHSEENDVS